MRQEVKPKWLPEEGTLGKVAKNRLFYKREGADTQAKIQGRHRVLKSSDGKVYATDKRGWRLIGQVITA